LKARGNFEVAINWKDRHLNSAVITSVVGGTCRVRTTVPVAVKGLVIKSKKDEYGYVLSFKTSKGQRYMLQAL
jgi:alpha-L-fucosidase 2